MIPLTTELSKTTTIDAMALPERDRFPFWDDMINTHFCPAANKPVGNHAAFQARIRMRNLGNVGLSELATTAMVSQRTQASLRSNPLDCFFVSHLVSGTAHMEQGGRQGVQKAGDFIIYDSARPFDIQMRDAYAGHWLRVPRSVMLNRMPNAEVLTARPLSGGSAVGRILTMMLNEAQMMELDSASPAAQRVASSMLDILAAAYETEAPLAKSGTPRHAALLDKAKSWIIANLEDGEMDCDRMVKNIGVSRRTLNRIFAPEGTTPIRWMWQQRLNRAHEMLTSGSETRVSDVAMKCGFSDFSHFARVFRNEFGVMPKSLLHHPH